MLCAQVVRMRRLTVSVVLLLASTGCGGTVRQDSQNTPRAGAPATGGSATTTGGASSSGGAQAPDGRTTEPLDDPERMYPELPDGGGAFFWRYGLGNWFVSGSVGGWRDATFQDLDGVRSWRASAATGEDIDLWAQLDHPQGRAIDLSGYLGISFDWRVIGASQPLGVAFNANGDVAAAAALPTPEPNTDPGWIPGSIRFEDAGQNASGISSFDFILLNAGASFDLEIRNVELLCKEACP